MNKSLKLIQNFIDSLETINFQNKFPITSNDHDRSILTSYAKMEFGKGYSLFKPRVLFQIVKLKFLVKANSQYLLFLKVVIKENLM